MSEPFDELAGQRVLVTGARGFIGGRLADRLAGGEVHAVTRGPAPTGARWAGVHWHQADLTDQQATSALLDTVRPDMVFHLASAVAGTRDAAFVLPAMQANLVAAAHLMAAALKRGGTRLVLAGSIEEPGPVDGERAASSPYAAAKWATTGYARLFGELWGLPVTVLRIAMVYGPGQADLAKLVPYVTLSLLRGRAPRLSSGERAIDWVYVDDVVEAFLAAAVRPDAVGQVVPIGSGDAVTIRDTVALLGRLTASDVAPQFGSLPDRKLDSARIAETGTAAARLGWHPKVKLEDGMARTVGWYRERLARGELAPPD